MREAVADQWSDFTRQIDELSASVTKVTATNVKSSTVRELAKQIVQYYFREARPYCVSRGLSEADIVEIDHALQNLNRLALGPNRKSSYLRELRALKESTRALTTKIDLLIGEANVGRLRLTVTQESILGTLERMVPSAALSFRQALHDLADGNRFSFRGPAAELRESLRETIDHLAPDTAVMSAAGFQLEHDKTRPTTKQKVRFIMRSRGKSATVSDTTVDAALRAETGAESLARSLQNRGSLATHVAAAKTEIRNIQRYTEVVLAELLEV